ncbi:dihydrofolate reductase [Catenovulum sp. 2E275]|uniref:dihydrofolate reductase n=1 Tax=Catenovulum sp. 2E275 TaxID=2980497 RepID=UPI0021CFD8BE|nr:dihydrofolate reductase [Catenovulum sp. 2E275]MCU4674415.1 dihydrofolate reductase [Catenovulum sp. 2E275]
MIISMIAAMTPDYVIGKDNQMLWHLPADFKFFKQTTLGKPIIMGRKTFESIGKPLPGRLNIVLSTGSDSPHPDVVLVNTPQEAITTAQQELEHGEENEIMVIGGGVIYQLFLPLADRLYITEVNAKIDGDAYFPQIDNTQWQEVSRTIGTVDEKNQLPHQFVTYQKIEMA